MNHEVIEKSIIFVADSLHNNIKIEDIQLSLAMMKELSTDLELILIAGKLLHDDRKNAPPKIGSFKRSI